MQGHTGSCSRDKIRTNWGCRVQLLCGNWMELFKFSTPCGLATVNNFTGSRALELFLVVQCLLSSSALRWWVALECKSPIKKIFGNAFSSLKRKTDWPPVRASKLGKDSTKNKNKIMLQPPYCIVQFSCTIVTLFILGQGTILLLSGWFSFVQNFFLSV